MTYLWNKPLGSNIFPRIQNYINEFQDNNEKFNCFLAYKFVNITEDFSSFLKEIGQESMLNWFIHDNFCIIHQTVIENDIVKFKLLIKFFTKYELWVMFDPDYDRCKSCYGEDISTLGYIERTFKSVDLANAFWFWSTWLQVVCMDWNGYDLLHDSERLANFF